MFVPTKESEISLTIKKSRFIAVALPFTDVKNLNTELSRIKKNYPKATHYLYAYQVNTLSKCNNDQEPGNIAQTFLRLINQYQLDEILIVVVRYFGGIKLGASNLLRTYHEVVNNVLKKINKANKQEVYLYKFKCDYSTFNKIKHAGFHIENVRYFDKIEIDIISKVNVLDSLKQFKVEELKVSKAIRVIDE